MLFVAARPKLLLARAGSQLYTNEFILYTSPCAAASKYSNLEFT